MAGRGAKTRKVVLTVKNPSTSARKKPSGRKIDKRRIANAIDNELQGDVVHNSNPGNEVEGSEDSGQCAVAAEAGLPNEISISNNGSGVETTTGPEREMSLIKGEFLKCIGFKMRRETHKILQVALENEKKQNAELRKRIEDMRCTPTNGRENGSNKQILRPRGTAGTDFSIQEAMGLSGNTKKYETYKALQVRQ
jgi:hypothetical protein